MLEFLPPCSLRRSPYSWSHKLDRAPSDPPRPRAFGANGSLRSNIRGEWPICRMVDCSSPRSLGDFGSLRTASCLRRSKTYPPQAIAPDRTTGWPARRRGRSGLRAERPHLPFALGGNAAGVNAGGSWRPAIREGAATRQPADGRRGDPREARWQSAQRFAGDLEAGAEDSRPRTHRPSPRIRTRRDAVHHLRRTHAVRPGAEPDLQSGQGGAHQPRRVDPERQPVGGSRLRVARSGAWDTATCSRPRSTHRPVNSGSRRWDRSAATS